MPIDAICTCDATYTLKDEFAGLAVECTKCGQPIQVPQRAAARPPPVGTDPVFARDQFLLRQKHLSISAKYYVWDERGQAILFVERPAHFLRNLGAAACGVVAALVAGGILGVLASLMPNDELKLAGAIIAVLAAIAALFVVGVALSAKRHVNFYRDDTKSDLLLRVFQDQKIAIIHATYTIADAAGTVLARLDKNYLYNIFRKRWYCHTPDGSLLCMAKEDSIMLSLLRRLLGPISGLLRANYIIVQPDGETLLGEFNRKFTILDRYSLDLTADPARTLDRRVALALGVMLDTGEKR
jgi:uncharacterized protein YxjI